MRLQVPMKLHRSLWPAAVILAAGVVAPLGILAVVSWSLPLDFGGVAWGKFSSDAYIGLLFERDFDGVLVFQSDFVQIFVRSVALAGMATIVCLLFALPVALHIAGCPPRRKALYLLLITVPFWTCVVVQMYGWITLLADNGLLNHVLNRIRVVDVPLGVLYTYGATLLGLVYTFLPFMVLPIYAALDDMDWRVVEAALDLGATGPVALRDVVIPGCRGGIAAGVGLVFVPALGTYVVSDLLGGNRSMMLGNLVAFQFSSGHNWPLGAAMAFALLGLVLVALVVSRVRLAVSDRGGVRHEFA
ncbi:ABC transporter permease [Paraburkholderia acidicola]|uniref:ABC transporter permease n=1 Tax=Paraburkholderia acidicola TaxID=1912599 RepID=A0A2A4ET34_9BURK|nr:ABC transporter permease [Paraburkholderia acidicola]PCE24015.1 ABC transporter permease [Paraburkholderia acidicola]